MTFAPWSTPVLGSGGHRRFGARAPRKAPRAVTATPAERTARLKGRLLEPIDERSRRSRSEGRPIGVRYRLIRDRAASFEVGAHAPHEAGSSQQCRRVRDMSDPDVRGHAAASETIVTLVHGTWARRATWTRPGSDLHAALVAEGCKVVRFAWSGRNSHRARTGASEGLAEHLRGQFRDNPTAKQIVVGHSHGGNVALHAVNHGRNSNSKIKRQVSVVTLATPFIYSERRAVSDWFKFLLLIFSIFAAYGNIVFFDSGGLSFLAIKLVAAVVILFDVELVLLVAGGLYHHNYFGYRYGDRLVEGIDAPEVSAKDNVLVIRAAGDEASFLLAAGQLAGWLGSITANRITGLVISGLLILVANGLPLVGALTGWLGPLPVEITIYGFMTWALVVILVVCTAMTASLIFGLDGPFVALFANTTSEPAPPGRPRLMQLEPFGKLNRARLNHSRLYDDENVISEVKRFVASVGHSSKVGKRSTAASRARRR